MRDLVKEQAPLSEGVIKQLHYLVLADKREDNGLHGFTSNLKAFIPSSTAMAERDGCL